MSTLRVDTVQLNQAGNATISLSNTWNVALISGSVAAITANYDGDIVVRRGIILTAANGAIYSITVANNGTLTSTKI